MTTLIGQGQPKVMVQPNYGGPESSMLHTKFLEIGPSVPEKNFFKVFTIYGHDGHLGHMTWTFI